MRQAKQYGFQIEHFDPSKPKLIEHAHSPEDIDWSKPLHEQVKPRLWGQPSLEKTPADFRLLRQLVPKLQEEAWPELVRTHEASSTEVFDPKLNSRTYLDLKEAATYILACPQWFNALQQLMMIVVRTRTWKDAAAKFQYIFNIIDAAFENYLPRWQIFVEHLDGLPAKSLRWKAPSTIWKGHPVIGFMLDTDFRDSAGNLPTEVGFRDFHPKWPYPPTAVNNSTDNITFGMDVTHFCNNPTTNKDALLAQCPIVRFNASTVLHSMGIIASRTLLPSSDAQGESRECAYCPTTWYYAHAYDTPAQHSDTLFEKDAPAILAHECVLSVIVQMSNKDQRHAQCANAHALSSVVSGMMISLTP